MNKCDSLTSIHLQIDKGQKAIVVDNEKTIQPNYYKIGNGTMNKDNVESINLIHEMIGLSKPAQKMIGMIVDKMVYDPFYYGKDIKGKWIGGIVFDVYLVPKDNAERKILLKGYKELSEKNLVKRIKRSCYMINPNAMITEYAKQIEVWNSIEANNIKTRKVK